MKTDSLQQNIQRVIKKNRTKRHKIEKAIGLITEEIDTLISTLEEDTSEDSEEYLKKTLEQFSVNLSEKKPLRPIVKVHKDFYVYISKLGKAINKQVNPNISSTILDFSIDDNALVKSITEYLASQGLQTESAMLLKERFGETEEQEDPKMAEESLVYGKLIDLQKEFDEGAIDSIISWVEENKTEFSRLESKLPKSLIKLKFTNLKQGGDLPRAFQLLKENKWMFKDEVAELGKVLYSATLEEENLPSNYSHLRKGEILKEMKKAIQSDLQKIMGFQSENPLFVIFKAGLIALPMVVRFLQKDYKEEQKSIEGELPISIEIGRKFDYHTLVVCPVSKEVCSENNRPFLFNCGHVVSENSLKKMKNITEIERNNNKLEAKCPTCPMKQPYDSLRPLIF